ncbi:MAG: hypothetical protein ACREA0_10195, partial [bacterium]
KLPSGTYLLAVSLWTFRGLQDTEKLAYAAIRLDDSSMLAPAEAEWLAHVAVQHGQDWLEELPPIVWTKIG